MKFCKRKAIGRFHDLTSSLKQSQKCFLSSLKRQTLTLILQVMLQAYFLASTSAIALLKTIAAACSGSLIKSGMVEFGLGCIILKIFTQADS